MPVFGSKDWFAEGKSVVGAEEAEIAEAKYLGYTPHLYKEYYPDGYSACVNDQKCRGNSDPKEACTKLMNGDASEIITTSKYAGGAVSSVLSGCPAVFRKTKLGGRMEATSLGKSAGETLVEGLSTPGYSWEEDPYSDTGGIGTTDKTPLITRVKLPEIPKIDGGFGGSLGGLKRSLQVTGMILMLFVLAIFYLIFVKGRGAEGVSVSAVGK